MIVSRFNLDDAIKEISAADRISLDTETTGLNPYKGDRVFSLIIHTDKEGYYFNFNTEADHLGNIIDAVYTFTYEEVFTPIMAIIDTFKYVYIHGAKFDLHQIAESCGYVDELLKANVFCTEAMARLVKNDLMSYQLSTLGKLIGFKKADIVDKYIAEHKLFTLVDVGKKELRKDKHFNLVPFEIITEYGLTDGLVCFKLGDYIAERLSQYNSEQLEQGYTGNKKLIETELALTKVLFKMERIGVAVNPQYCEDAIKYYVSQLEKAKVDFKELTGLDFVDSRKCLAPAFEKLGLSYPLTDKGNPSFKESVLEGIDNPVANIIKAYRAAYKSAYTYYKNFLDLSDDNNILHTNLRQGGTATGRMSCREPNLQNVPKRKDMGELKARKAFVPRKGFFFAMIDYDQMEYRLFMDYAEEMALIQKVLDGLDVHTATAEMVLVERDVAKTINFLLLYGGGDKILAETLAIELYKAKEYKSKYFQNLQNVKSITRSIIHTAEKRGYIFNIMGRRCYIPKKLAYKAPNYLIQGGCGDIVKSAMIELDKYLDNKKSRMILQIHDEILYEIAYDEYNIIEDLKKIQIAAHKHKYLPLTAGADYSFNSWYDKEGVNYGEIISRITDINAS